MSRLTFGVAMSAVLAVCALGSSGCSADPATSDECLGETADALRTCAEGATLKGIDVSVYQGSVAWTKVKKSGRTFAFVRASDGINHPDSKFAQNWPAAKAAGIVRGVYQFFRPSQDPKDQADLMLAKLSAAGGLKPGDLPPVLDLESTDGRSASVVRSRAKTWLKYVESQVGVKPIVYTANFMSSAIGTGFGGYTLWVANYGATCPLMPSGWKSWHFWQDADDGDVPGVAGNVDTDLFNGKLADLKALTLQPAAGSNEPEGPEVSGFDRVVVPHGAIPYDGSEGATLGSGAAGTAETDGAPLEPCAP